MPSHMSPQPDPIGDNSSHLKHVAEMMREHLASIQGFAELLLTEQYDETTRRDLTATLLAEAEALSNIINQHLDIRTAGHIDR